MSDYESHSGKIRIIEPMGTEDFEQLCLRLWIENGQPAETYKKGELFGQYHEKYFHSNDRIWEIIEHDDLDDEDMFCNLHDNKDGTCSFYTRFYNGGTCMSEMIEEALEELAGHDELGSNDEEE